MFHACFSHCHFRGTWFPGNERRQDVAEQVSMRSIGCAGVNSARP